MNSTSMHLRVLPGVRRHVHRVQGHLTSGRSCAWVLPASMTSPQRVRQLLELVEEAVPIVEVDPPAALPVSPTPSPADTQGEAVVGTIEEMLRAAFDADHEPPPPDPRPEHGLHHPTLAHRMMQAVHQYFPHLPDPPADDPLSALASQPVPSPVVVVVHADKEHDADAVTALIHQYPALVREQPEHNSDRAVLLVIGTVARLRGIERADPLITGIHWWWGVLSRLDLLTVATVEATANGGWHRELLDDLCSDLLPEVIAEVAGPDIDLAADLARNWDGTHDDLVNRVTSAVDAEGNDATAGYRNRDPAGSAPSQRLWDQWTAGRVDAWGGRTRPSLRAVPKDDLAKVLTERLWVGQARALNPVLDEIRHHLLDAVRDSAPASTMAELNRLYCNGAGVDTIELKDLRRAIREEQITIGSRHRDLLDHAVRARNQLAHREFVPDSRLRAISRLSRGH